MISTSETLKVIATCKHDVAGMKGKIATTENPLTLTEQGIEGDREYAILSRRQFERHQKNPSHLPVREGWTSMPQLSQFQAETIGGTLVITHNGESFLVEESQNLGEAIPIRSSSKSKTPRVARRCCPAADVWLSQKLGEDVYLVKIDKSLSQPKEHFTYYSAFHAVTTLQLALISRAVGYIIDPRILRPNLILRSHLKPKQELESQILEEAALQRLYAQEVELRIQSCKRCGYVAIDLLTGQLAQHMEVLEAIKPNQLTFGWYLSAPSGENVTLQPGDVLRVA
jgi:uncharacterized protein YcbX